MSQVYVIFAKHLPTYLITINTINLVYAKEAYYIISFFNAQSVINRIFEYSQIDLFANLMTCMKGEKGERQRERKKERRYL
jgi:hypothetical protein